MKREDSTDQADTSIRISTQDQVLLQKHQKRKEQHSQIEKRRRERMQKCFQDLKTLVPGMSNQENLQKLQILESTVNYLRKRARMDSMDSSNNMSINHPLSSRETSHVGYPFSTPPDPLLDVDEYPSNTLASDEPSSSSTSYDPTSTVSSQQSGQTKMHISNIIW